MLKKSLDAKVRPYSTPSLEKASLAGAARIYISRDSFLSLAGKIENGRYCIVEKLDDPSVPARKASLWILPEKNVNNTVAMMSRAFQAAAGFTIGDQVRITLCETSTPDAEEVVVEEVNPDPETDVTRPHFWSNMISPYLGRAELIFPGMVFEAISLGTLRKTFKVISVNDDTTGLVRFQLNTSLVRILSGDEETEPVKQAPAGDLVLTKAPGLSHPAAVINRFLQGFSNPPSEYRCRRTCGLVVHGSSGIGKTFILKRLADTNWGHVYWIKPSDKVGSIRDTFNQAMSNQPSFIFIEKLETLLHKDAQPLGQRTEAIREGFDSLAALLKPDSPMPRVVIVATCEDYATDVPVALQENHTFSRHIALPNPGPKERLEILRSFEFFTGDDEEEQVLQLLAQKTHAYNPRDLRKLAGYAVEEFGFRLRAWEEGQVSEKPRLSVDDANKALTAVGPSAMRDINLKPPIIHWQDIGGQDDVKGALKRMIMLTKHQKMSTEFLKQPPKGLLLFGPPGCSKTLSAQAMATESGFNFFAVKGAELLNMYVGESERAIRQLFTRARAASPSIIFFDEIDSIGGQRGEGGSRSSGSVNMLTTLLTEMDGFESLRGVLILAATNRPQSIDSALLRQGRFDQILYVGLPDHATREAIFNVNLRHLRTQDINVTELATRTAGHSGAEITGICQKAGMAVLWPYLEALETNGEGEAPLPSITMDNFLAAIKGSRRGVTAEMLEEYRAWEEKFEASKKY
ncbi:AAA family ATPase [Stachybotrys elegans]|uniref:AAA family ATPase n=1 Tax=Stachybotrys elegans TaxID=80388 RepID=A0A8K0T191_9HYPO|nr:AAA family ATPase [Stachybotrys elegans]